MIVDDQPHPGGLANRKQSFRQLPDFDGGEFLGSQLDEVRSSVAELPGDIFRRSIAEIGCIDKHVELALGE
jgi:hypothetical protein